VNWETLLTWGDSITIGARSYLAYGEYAGKFLSNATHREWHTPVHATCGFTANDLNRSLTPLMPTMKSFQPSFLTILIGTNDLKGPTTRECFRVAYRQVLVKARLICRPSQILAIEIPHLKTGVMYPYQMGMNKTVDHFNEDIREISRDFKVRTLKLHLEDDDLFDGVHLTEEGSEHVAWQITELVLHDRGLTVPLSNGLNLEMPSELQNDFPIGLGQA